MILTLILIAVVALLAFIRFAPTDVSRWHRPVGPAEDATGEGWAARVIPAAPDLVSDLHQGMLALPRTELLAGSVGEGLLTYITRSKWIGFPDYTTIERDGDHIKLYARLRFGKSDMGVNAARLDGLIKSVRAKRRQG
ncbi:DUF1499 domain-containing protein [uncultured Sulfitobacter sp.]|uniref:DUF1499 domain-containing protein n=1 Tax=uncultured Sulfitobacter sp. TaxID=191468 RepID=UPI00262B6E1B|nr:DUF1499 domain-containing protein [uncultured Sulfitobacter sp.]